MPSDISLLKAWFLRDLARMAVRDWATVSAMPPRICSTHCIQLIRTRVTPFISASAVVNTYGVRDHDGEDCGELLATASAKTYRISLTWPVGIVGVEFGYQPRHDSQFYNEYDCV